MSSTLSSARSKFSAGLWPTKPSVDATLVPAAPENDRVPSVGKRASQAVAFLITFCIGVAATLAWQSSSATIATPQAAVVAQAASDMNATPAAPSPDLAQQLEAMSLGLAAVRHSVDELADGQERITRDITKMQDILDKMISAPPPRPAPVPTPARKP